MAQWIRIGIGGSWRWCSGAVVVQPRWREISHRPAKMAMSPSPSPSPAGGHICITARRTICISFPPHLALPIPVSLSLLAPAISFPLCLRLVEACLMRADTKPRVKFNHQLSGRISLSHSHSPPPSH